jgi:WD40 repeat protein
VKEVKLTHLFVILSVVTSSLFGSMVVESPGVKAASLSSPPRAITLTDNQKQSLDLAVSLDGRIYAVWSERIGTDYDIMFSFSSNNGTTFSSPIVVNQQTTGNQFYPSIGVDSAGTIFVAWWDQSSDSGDIMISRSLDKGRSFQNETRVNSVTEGEQTHPSLGVSQDKVALVWEESRQNNSIMIWRFDGSLTSTLAGHTGAVRATDYSPNGTLLASGAEDNLVKIWQVQSGLAIVNITTHMDMVTTVNWSSDGSKLATGSWDNDIYVWSASTLSQILKLNSTNGEQLMNPVNSVAWLPDNEKLVAAYNGKAGPGLPSGPENNFNITFWNTNTLSNWTVNEFNGWHTNSVMGISPSHNGSLLASCSKDRTVKVWNSTTIAATSTRPFMSLTDTPNSVTATVSVPTIINNQSTNRFEFVVNDTSGTSRGYAFNVTINNVTRTVYGNTSANAEISFFLNFTAGSVPEALNTDLIAEMFNSTDWVQDAQSLSKIDVKNVTSVAFNSEARAISWSPDDASLAVGLANGSIAVFNVSNPTDIYWMGGKHTGRVNVLSWSEIRNEVASGASDPKAKIWDQVAKTERAVLQRHINSVYALDWAGNGTYLATAGGISGQYQMGENQIFCAVSLSSGLNFSAPVMIQDTCSGMRYRPQTDMDSNGIISVVWYDYRNSNIEDIYFANSTDNGQTFSSNLLVSNFPSSVDNSPTIAVEASGTVHVAWQHQVSGTTMSPVYGIWYANSTDSFLTGQDISGAGQMPKVATSSSGTAVWVMWRDPGLTLSAKASFDHGLTFPDTSSVAVTAVDNSAIFIDAYNQTSIVWLDWPLLGYGIYYAGTEVDDYPPSVTGTAPFNGQAGVPIFSPFPLAAPIQINFSEPMDNPTTEAAFSWTDGTQTWRLANCSEVIWSGYGDTVQFRPREPLKYQMNYVVVIGTGARDISGNQMQAQYTFSFSTSNDIDPPIINFTQTVNEINYDENYTISATIIDQWGTVSSANVHYQGVNDAAPVNAISMEAVNSTTYNASIPAQLALGNVSFYFEAEDTGGNVGTLPLNLSQGYFNFTVVDQTKPEISHIQVTEAPVYQTIEIWAVVTDEINLTSVELYYKGVQESSFSVLTMQPGNTSNAFNCTIPAQQDVGNLQYNLTARDASGNVNVTSDFVVQIKDLVKPTIHWVRPEYLANNTEVLVRANVTDDVGVDVVTLYFKAVGGNRWVERQMHQVDPVNSPEIYEFTIPAQDRSGFISYYVNATDTTGNIASTLEQEQAYEVEVVGVGNNWLVYILLIAVLAVLIIAFVYLVLKKYRGRKSKMAEEPLEERSTPQPEEVAPSTEQESQQRAGKQ